MTTPKISGEIAGHRRLRGYGVLQAAARGPHAPALSVPCSRLPQLTGLGLITRSCLYRFRTFGGHSQSLVPTQTLGSDAWECAQNERPGRTWLIKTAGQRPWGSLAPSVSTSFGPGSGNMPSPDDAGVLILLTLLSANKHG